MADHSYKTNVAEDTQASYSPSASEKEFSNEDLLKAWTAFAEKINEESPRISITLSSLSPEVAEDKSITLRLDNSALKETFDHSYKNKLEHYLRETLQNSRISVNTSVEATERGDILYTDTQKFNHLAAKNPALGDLKKSLGLEIE